MVLAMQAQHPLRNWECGRLSLQHGPLYTQGWNLYGKNGPRVIRYSAAMAWSTDAWSIEAGLRPQAGLAPHVPDYMYWSVGVSFRFSQPLTAH